MSKCQATSCNVAAYDALVQSRKKASLEMIQPVLQAEGLKRKPREEDKDLPAAETLWTAPEIEAWPFPKAELPTLNQCGTFIDIGGDNLPLMSPSIHTAGVPPQKIVNDATVGALFPVVNSNGGVTAVYVPPGCLVPYSSSALSARPQHHGSTGLAPSAPAGQGYPVNTIRL